MIDTKSKLLKHLKQQNGIWISGEVLSRKLEISRAAVNKHIKSLKNTGYIIESVTKKGYLLKEKPDRLFPDEVKENLNTEYIGNTVKYFQELKSTNITARELAESQGEEGTIVIAETQTEGKGRRGREWFSAENKGIYASLLLKPRIPPSQAPRITLMTSVALCEVLIENTNLPVKIKWPNDLLINGKKTAGILTEMSADIEQIHFIIVGFGVNINTEQSDFNPDIKKTATSLLIESGNKYSRLDILQQFLKRFETYYNLFKKNDFSLIIEKWKIYSDIIGKEITVDNNFEKISGKAVDVDIDGILYIENSKGKLISIYSGDVFYRE